MSQIIESMPGAYNKYIPFFLVRGIHSTRMQLGLVVTTFESKFGTLIASNLSSWKSKVRSENIKQEKIQTENKTREIDTADTDSVQHN